MESWIVLSVIWGLLVTIFWMVVGWRAMRAHEHIAGELRHFVRGDSVTPTPQMVSTPPYECPNCNMISKQTTMEGCCPHCGRKVDRPES